MKRRVLFVSVIKLELHQAYGHHPSCSPAAADPRVIKCLKLAATREGHLTRQKTETLKRGKHIPTLRLSWLPS
jgi:hypothetical protein